MVRALIESHADYLSGIAEALTCQQMACTLRVPPATVESRLREAREGLSKRVLSSLGNPPANQRHAFT